MIKWNTKPVCSVEPPEPYFVAATNLNSFQTKKYQKVL